MLESRFLRVPRLGAESRFLPAKSWEQLDAHRAQIAARIKPMLAQVRDSP